MARRSWPSAARDAEAAQAGQLARQANNKLAAGGAVQWVDAEALPKPSADWTDVPARPSQVTPAAVQVPASGPTLGQAASPFGPPALR